MPGPVAPNDAGCAADTLRGGRGHEEIKSIRHKKGAIEEFRPHGRYLSTYSDSLWPGGVLPQCASVQYSIYFGEPKFLLRTLWYPQKGVDGPK